MALDSGRLAELRTAVATVVDPEIPVLTIDDLGVLRDVALDRDTVVVTITPTYSGCPAMDLIKDQIALTLELEGVDHYRIDTVFAPAWTTDWLSDEAREKLRSVGIAPPGRTADGGLPKTGSAAQVGVVALRPAASQRDLVLCPQCSSGKTRTISEFGSTACKSLMVCESCREPFDLFKQL